MTRPTRHTRSRAKGWRKPEGAVIVSRGTIWGNPWIVGNPGGLDALGTQWRLPAEYTALDAVNSFERWLSGATDWYATELPNIDEWWAPHHFAADLATRRALILRRLPELRGRDLVCWCKPGCACHADVLLRLANGDEH